MTARALYTQPIEFKMVLCCNQVPHAIADDEGFWRRASVLEFVRRFVDHPNPANPNELSKNIHLSDMFPL